MKLTFVSATSGTASCNAGRTLPNGCIELVNINPLLDCVFSCDVAPSPAQLDRIRSLPWVNSVSLQGTRLTVVVLQASVPKSMASYTMVDFGTFLAAQMG